MHTHLYAQTVEVIYTGRTCQVSNMTKGLKNGSTGSNYRINVKRKIVCINGLEKNQTRGIRFICVFFK